MRKHSKTKERSFYGHMRNNQNRPKRQIDSNNVNGQQLPTTSPVYNNSRRRIPYRSQSRNGYYNKSISRDNRNYQGSRNHNRSNNNKSISYNGNNYNRNRYNSYNRNNAIIDTTIVDQTLDTQTVVTRDKIHHTTEISITIIIIIIIITIITTDKDNIAKIQREVIDIDKDQIVIIDIILKIITEIIEEVHQIENRTTDTIRD